ncbi:SPOR domain-containing protein [Sphingomonas sp. GlSt437]|uniref:SPOR domain-containing protein n=1 Tax=Sphingomonas sp. GlSt437 TaxID=3389970 RepID=UPI003A8A229D
MPLRNNVGRLGLALGVALLLQAQTLPPPPDDLPQGTGPRGTSQVVPGQERYDAVGYAMVEPAGGDSGQIGVTSRKAGAGSFVEITSLDTGKTIAAMVTGQGPSLPDREVGLSPAAAAALGISASVTAPVRIRVIEPSQPDQVALRAGHAGGDRLDTPKVLLTALRKRLPPPPSAVAPPVTPPRRATRRPQYTPAPAAPPEAAPVPASTAGASYAAPATDDGIPAEPQPVRPVRRAAQAPAVQRPTAQPAPSPASTAPVPGGLYVQIAALSDPSRASALAGTVGGSVVTGGGLYRVRLGPYRDQRTAESARDAMVRQGYGDAHIVTNH